MNIGIIVIKVVALFMALTFHEFAHGWIARKLGDRTAEVQGRLSLNPKDHIDPFGTICGQPSSGQQRQANRNHQRKNADDRTQDRRGNCGV